MNNIWLTRAGLAVVLALTLGWVPPGFGGCNSTLPRLRGKTLDHGKELGEIKTLLGLVTEGAPDKSGKLEKVLQALSPGRMPAEDTIAALQKRLLEAIVRLKSEDLVGTDPSFQKAVGLLRSWDAEYPPELVRPRTTGLFTYLADMDLSQEEIQKLNTEIKNDYTVWVAHIREEAESGTGNPARSQLRRRADDGHILQPIDGLAKDVVITPKRDREKSGAGR